MGSIETKQTLPNKSFFDILDYGYCIVWRRKNDQFQLMQQYSVSIQSNQRLKLYQTVWPLRTKYNNLVNVFYFSHEKTSNFCAEIAKGSIFTQRIPYRLSQFYNMPIQQNLNILKKSLQIFKELQENFGSFIVRSTMIGFTQNFILKIWFHTDFSQPQPENQNCSHTGQMIKSIINAIQSVCQNYYYSFPKFSDFLNFGQYSDCFKNFQHTLKALNDFMNKMRVNSTDNFSNIKNFKKKPEGWQKFKPKSIYPILIQGQNLQIQKKSLRKDIYGIQSPSNRIMQTENTLSKRISNHIIDSPIIQRHSKNITNERMINQSFRKQNDKSNSILINKFQIKPSNPYIPTGSQNTIRFWKSNQKIQQRSPSKQLTQKLFSSQLNKYQSPIKNVSTRQFQEYYGNKNLTQFNKPLVKFTPLNNNDYSQRKIRDLKNAEISTTTDNFERSERSTISLIQDLQIRQSQSRKFYNLRNR